MEHGSCRRAELYTALGDEVSAFPDPEPQLAYWAVFHI